MEKQTPLYQKHLESEGRMVPFAGFVLPVQYPTGVIAEHMAVRQQAGIFDVSHMGEVMLEGPDAVENLNRILTNSFTTMPQYACRYSLMLYPDGGQVDDLIVYKFNDTKFLIVLNASNASKDIAWLREHVQGDVTLTDLCDATAQIALQGPLAKEVIAKLCNVNELPQKYYTFVPEVEVAGVCCLVSRTGYTGEFGYELYMDPAEAPKVWEALLGAGAVPCGLGCRDTLRLEAAMPLYGHELGEGINPLAAGLGFVVKMDKEDFIGKAAIVAQGEPPRVRVGLRVTGRGVIREQEVVTRDGAEIGKTTSGTHCPFLGVGCAMAYLDRAYSEIGTTVEVMVRGRAIAAEVVPLPFYKKA